MRLSQRFLLFRSSGDGDGIATEKSCQHGSRDPEIDAGHLLTNAIDVERASTHAAELLRNKQQLNAQLVRVAHVADDFQGTLVASIEVDQHIVRQTLLGKFLERLHTQF